MKKVLILEGSPRRNGNSAILSDEFARGAEETGCSLEKIQVAHKKVAGCLGCNACYRNGGVCVQKDDMAEIREKMMAADVIVLTSPIYFYSMTAPMRFFSSWRERPSISSSPAARRTFPIPRRCWRRFAALPAAFRTRRKAAMCWASARWRRARYAAQKRWKKPTAWGAAFLRYNQFVLFYFCFNLLVRQFKSVFYHGIVQDRRRSYFVWR